MVETLGEGRAVREPEKSGTFHHEGQVKAPPSHTWRGLHRLFHQARGIMWSDTPVSSLPRQSSNLWVPATRPCYAVCVYWGSSPPRRSRRQTRKSWLGCPPGSDRSGAARLRARCGRCSLKCRSYSASTVAACRCPRDADLRVSRESCSLRPRGGLDPEGPARRLVSAAVSGQA